MKLRRIIIFAEDVILLTDFYHRVLGLKPVFITKDRGWSELESGGFKIAFHSGGKKGIKNKQPKLVFYAANVAKKKTKLEKKGCSLGVIFEFENIHLCNGTDPEGNVFQISDRK